MIILNILHQNSLWRFRMGR